MIYHIDIKDKLFVNVTKGIHSIYSIGLLVVLLMSFKCIWKYNNKDEMLENFLILRRRCKLFNNIRSRI